MMRNLYDLEMIFTDDFYRNANAAVFLAKEYIRREHYINARKKWELGSWRLRGCVFSFSLLFFFFCNDRSTRRGHKHDIAAFLAMRSHRSRARERVDSIGGI